MMIELCNCRLDSELRGPGFDPTRVTVLCL